MKAEIPYFSDLQSKGPIRDLGNENATTLDVLSENCFTHRCSHFCDLDVPPNFQCQNSKCLLLWHRDCMKIVVDENEDVKDIDQFEYDTTEICVNCFIDQNIFWTHSYQCWDDIPSHEKKKMK